MISFGGETFPVKVDWYSEFLDKCTDAEKACFLDAMFLYNMTGEIMESDDRFVDTMVKVMVDWFEFIEQNKPGKKQSLVKRNWFRR